MLRECIAVGLGGMLGTLGRYSLAWFFSLFGSPWLPIATLTANLLGCLAIGFVASWSLQQPPSNAWWIVGVRVGLLGGLTTFSSFALEVIREWQTGRTGFSILLLAVHIGAGLAAVLLGMHLGSTQAQAST